MSYLQHALEDGRLIILRSLADQPDYRLNETLIGRTLESFGHRWAYEKLRDQLAWLEFMGALHVTEAGGVRVARVTRKGVDHVESRFHIEGVARPSPEA